MFKVARILDNSRSRIIGFQVISESVTKGTRFHASREGKPVLIGEALSDGLIKAEAAMQAHADKLNAEAEANRARQ